MMSFGAPLWLAAGALVAGGVFLLHLLRRTDREPQPLPTARFIPEREATQVVRWSRLSDTALLATRIATVLTLTLAMAEPRLTWRRQGIARLVLMDRSRAATVDSSRAALTRWREGATVLRMVAFDSVARVVSSDAALTPVTADGSLSAALVIAAREALQLRASFDSVEVLLLSPLLEGELDAATRSIRAQIGLSIQLVRAAPRTAEASVSPAAVATTLPFADPLGAAVRSTFPVRDDARVRMVRVPVSADDAAWARESGHALVVWPNAGAAAAAAEWTAVASRNGAAIGALARGNNALSAGRAIIRWADGSPAATEAVVGAGCVRTVSFAPADEGDFALSPSFRRQLLVLAERCGGAADGRPVPDSALGWLRDAPRVASRVKQASEPTPGLRTVLLVLSLLLALGELVLRSRRPVMGRA